MALVSRVALLHDKRAFDALVRKYQSPVRRFLLNLTLGNEALSDDLAQDTFVKAYTRIAQFKATAQFSTWLMRIAYNTFYDHRRSLHPPTDALEQHYALGTAAKDSGITMDIYRALALLSPDERSCITLQLIDQQPIEYICRVTGMKAGTVKSHLFRGKEKLATFLKQNGYDPR